MAPRSRYAVDPSLTALAQPQASQWDQQQQEQHQQQQQQYPTFSPADLQQPHQSYQQQQPYVDPTGSQLRNVDSRHVSAPTGAYAPTSQERQQQRQQHLQQQRQQQEQEQQHQSTFNYPPENHIRPPPHSAGPAGRVSRVRIDPSQLPDPVEVQELDQNLYDDEDFHSCDTKGLTPMAITDWRGVDQGNSLPRHLRPTLPVIPSTPQLLDTTALPLGLIVQPFAPLRYDEAPVPLVSNFVSGESAFDPPRVTPGGGVDEEQGPPRCEKCRAYINPWVRFVDSGRKWACNLCGALTDVPHLYFSHLAPTGQRTDHHNRPELLHGTVDFPVPRSYWSPLPTGSLLDSAGDSSVSNLAAAGDALASTGADLLGALQSSLGQTPTRGPSPAVSHKDKTRGGGTADDVRLRRPAPISRVFVIDVSAPSAQRGIVREVCEAIRLTLYGSKRSSDGAEQETGEEGTGELEDEEVIGRGEKVGIVTVSHTVGFWNLSPKLTTPSLLVVSDLDDMFCPLYDGFLADVVESRSLIDALLDLIPTLAEQQPEGPACAIGAGIKGALSGLRMVGGQINFFLSGLPTLGPGKLKPREDSSLAGTDKERALFAPADPFWRVTAEDIAECGIGVNGFLFPDQATDMASIGALSGLTGGEMFYHPKFHPVRDREILHEELRRIVVRELAYNVTVRVRCSNGLRVSDHVGNYYQRFMTDLEFGTLDQSKAFGVTIKYDSKLDAQQAYFQVAILYTSHHGERRVRCLNMCVSVSNLIGNIFRFCDFDAIVAIFFKEAVAQLPQRKLPDIKKQLMERCNRVLLMYRKHCATAVQAGQLILPDGCKLLPLFTLAMVKSKPLKGGNVIPDVRSHYIRIVKGLGVAGIMTMLYPRLLAIHDLADSIGFPGHNGRLRMPRFMRNSYAYMVAEGAYLMCNGETIMIWFGGAVSPRVLDELYGVENIDELDVRITRLPKLPTLLSTQLRNIISHLERLSGRSLPVLIVRQDRDGMEIEFANNLVEDSNNDALSYMDFLMTAHRAITDELAGKSGDGWKAPWS